MTSFTRATVEDFDVAGLTMTLSAALSGGRTHARPRRRRPTLRRLLCVRVCVHAVEFFFQTAVYVCGCVGGGGLPPLPHLPDSGFRFAYSSPSLIFHFLPSFYLTFSLYFSLPLSACLSACFYFSLPFFFLFPFFFLPPFPHPSLHRALHSLPPSLVTSHSHHFYTRSLSHRATAPQRSH